LGAVWANASVTAVKKTSNHLFHFMEEIVSLNSGHYSEKFQISRCRKKRENGMP
jgi:hypothetical protein